VGGWPDIVAAVRARSALLGEALAAGTVAAVAPPAVTLSFGADSAHMREGVERQRGVVEEVLGASVGAPVALRFGGQQAPKSAAAARPRRLSGEAVKAEKLERFRQTDPVLDLAATELDLEVVDDSPKGF
jgi:hypothetical protein